ncbi:hypothetical protein BH11MYX4_BH11MYX4_43040 [soil metagenome]
MRPPPREWHAVAEARLASVLGPAKGATALAEALRAVGLSRVATAHDLHRLAQHLSGTGGFASAVGGLLSVHAILHGGDLALTPRDAAGSDPPA